MPPKSKSAPVLRKDPEVEESSHVEEVTESPELEEVKKKPKAPKEKFWRVQFLDKRDESELDYHYLAVNGEALQVTKGSEVIIPERFLVVADNAVIKQFKKGRPVGEISRCPYRKICEATEAEFIKMRNDGSKKHREDLEKSSRASEKNIEG